MIRKYKRIKFWYPLEKPERNDYHSRQRSPNMNDLIQMVESVHGKDSTIGEGELQRIAMVNTKLHNFDFKNL